MQQLKLKSLLSPGDALAMTSAIYSLHQQYPGEYETDVETSAMEIWENNPDITKLEDTSPTELHYPLVHKSNQILTTFLNGYVQGLADVIQRPLQLQTNRPHLYLTENEAIKWMDQAQQYLSHGKKLKYWLINSGTKNDFTCKQWPIEYYQEVINETRGMIQWIQVGSKEHRHHPLSGVIDFRGKTNHRELIRLVYHSRGAVGPVTYLQHLCAAFEKPYMCLLGGREGVGWTVYPRQQTFHTIGLLSCCQHGGCWKSRVVPLEDGKEQDKSVCEQPSFGGLVPSPKCMAMIHPSEVISVLRRSLQC